MYHRGVTWLVFKLHDLCLAFEMSLCDCSGFQALAFIAGHVACTKPPLPSIPGCSSELLLFPDQLFCKQPGHLRVHVWQAHPHKSSLSLLEGLSNQSLDFLGLGACVCGHFHRITWRCFPKWHCQARSHQQCKGSPTVSCSDQLLVLSECLITTFPVQDYISL